MARALPFNPTDLTQLTERQRRLINLCRDNPYCRVRNLHFSNGEPSFVVPPVVETQVRLGCGKTTKAKKDAQLTTEEQELLEVIRQRGEGVVLEVDVREGTPRDLKFQTVAA